MSKFIQLETKDSGMWIVNIEKIDAIKIDDMLIFIGDKGIYLTERGWGHLITHLPKIETEGTE